MVLIIPSSPLKRDALAAILTPEYFHLYVSLGDSVYWRISFGLHVAELQATKPSNCLYVQGVHVEPAIIACDGTDHPQLSAEEGRVGSDLDTRVLPFVRVVGRLGVLEDLLRSARLRTASNQTIELPVRSGSSCRASHNYL